ncbi:MAG: hypothetical protein NUV51_11620, partial [Sulfuricaulis sp.]|nr:hypothetical protein [Sulfuricaulis sp.]
FAAFKEQYDKLDADLRPKLKTANAELNRERKAREEAERVSELRKQEWGRRSSTCAKLQTRAEAAEAKLAQVELELARITGDTPYGN